MKTNEYGHWLDVRSFAPPNYPRDGSADWYPYLQSAVDYIVGQSLATTIGQKTGIESGTLYLPPGIYKISQPIQVRLKYSGSYTFCSIHIVGDSPGFGFGFHGTILLPDFSDKPALILQSVRAVKVENIVFQGKNNWTSLSGRDPGNMATHHRDDDHNYLASCSVRDNRYSPHAGIHIDPYNQAVLQSDRYPGLENEYINSGHGAGSSAVSIQNCKFRDFVVGVGISLNGITQNAENITLVDCSFQSMKSAIAIGQDQSRNITVYNVVISGAKIAFDCTSYGKGSGNCPSIFGANIDGVKYIFHTFSFGSAASINGLYSELIYSIGTLGAGGANDGYVFNGCAFNFANSPPGQGAIVYRLACMTFAVFSGCQFSLSKNEPIWIINSGRMSFNSCWFYGSTTPDDAFDASPKLWINGNRERVSFNNNVISMTCAPWVHAGGANFADVLSIDYKINPYDVPMLPGTIFYSNLDYPSSVSPSLRWVASGYPLVDLGDCQIIVPNPGDGTATFLVPAQFEGLIAPGDFIWAYSKSFYPLDPPYTTSPISIVLGKVATVTATQTDIQVVLAYVPKIVTIDTILPTETIRLFVIYLPRVHLPTTGEIDFSVSNTKIISIHSKWFSQYERIRDRQGCILEGTFIINDPDADGYIQLSRPATGSGQMTLDLYDADVREINMTPV